MRYTKRKKRLSLLIVLVLGVTAIIGLMCGLVFWMSGQSIASFEAFIIESKYQETKSLSDSVSKDTDALITLMYNELSDTVLTKLRLFYESKLLNYSYLEQANLIQKQLYAIEKALAFSSDIKIYLLDYQRVISSSSILRYGEEESQWLQSVQELKSGDFYAEDGDLLFVLSRNAGDSLYRQSVMVVAKLSRYNVTHYLRKFAPENSPVILAMYTQKDDKASFFTSSNYSFSDESEEVIGSSISKAENGNSQYNLDNERYLLTWGKVTHLPIKICQITPMNILTARLFEYRAMISTIIVLVLLLMCVLVLFLYLLIMSPIRKMKTALKSVSNGDLKVRINSTWSREYQEIFGQFNQMTEKLEHLIEQEYKLNLLSIKAEIKQLRYQISPHFLYNAYFNLRAMLVDEDYDQAANMAGLIGRYLRYITTSIQDEASLKEELDHSFAYMEIQKLRFGGHLEIRIKQIPHQALNVNIPRIIIQPIIENAFEHGIKHQREQGIISIEVSLDQDTLSIVVDDNGCLSTDQLIQDIQDKLHSGKFEANSESVALLNINRRIELLYKEGSGLFVSRSPLGGFRSQIKMIGVSYNVSNDDR